MQRVNQWEFYRIGWILHRLGDIKDGTPLIVVKGRLLAAKSWLTYLLDDRLVPLVTTRESMKSLVQTITAINASADIESQAKEEDGRPVLTETQAYLLKSKFDTFETVLAAELGTLDAYFVSQKLAYETRVLIEQADKLIPESLRSELPQETTNDLRQAGRCIAFDIPTAAGFHIIRAAESVIRKYYNAVVGNVPKPKMRNWGAYIKNLAAAGADTRITGFLDHIRENHRNPILHPEETLSAEDSQVLLGTAISTIVQMMLEIRKITQMKEITDEDIPF